MGRTVPFTRRDRKSRRPPHRPETVTLANKLQILLLTHPVAARELEKLVDRMLSKPDWIA